MKKLSLILSFVALLCLALPAFAVDEPAVKDLQPERETDVFVDGTRMGDLVLGARGSIQFIYVDEKLARAVVAEKFLETWVYDMVQFYGTDKTKKKLLFMVHVIINKPWDFDPQQIFVGNYHLTKDDILSSSMTNPFGLQPSKSDGFFAFVVPTAAVKGLKEVKIGYGDDSETWKIVR